MFDCRGHGPFGSGGAFVEHGAVVVKEVVQHRCGNPNEHGYAVWYTPAPGFRGVDHVTFPASHRWDLVIDVTVQ
jgi:hypothetical protein